MIKRLLIANRGEIAIRIARTASDLGIATTAIYSEDDAQSLHIRHADTAVPLGASGVPAYLDGERIVAIAKESGCDAIHPGYGFLSELASFAASCDAAGLTFVGPSVETLQSFGHKAQARSLAESCGVPVLNGISRPVTFNEALTFMESMGPGGAVMLKAVAGGGGRGMRPVHEVGELREAFERATSEAQQSFGSGELYVEELLPRARHIEVQVVGDGSGAVSHLWDRECSLQRQRQKLIEIAPAFGISEGMRSEMLAAATRIASLVKYRGVGTIEFLVDARLEGGERFVFMEANARLQVEHTVTEEITGLDLVAVQLKIAGGATLSEVALEQFQVPAARGVALQARINLETMMADGNSRPGGGVLTAYDPPAGPGIRVDGFGYAGYATSSRYDSLLAKLIVHADTLEAVSKKARRALAEFKISGARNNGSFLQGLLSTAPLTDGMIYTRYVEDHAAEILNAETERPRYFEPAERDVRKAGTRVDPDDPLAVLSLKGATASSSDTAIEPAPFAEGPDGTVAVAAPLQGMIIALHVTPGDVVRKGQPVAVMEALKMEHIIRAEVAGTVREIALEIGDTIYEDTPILFVEPQDVEGEYRAEAAPDPDSLRPDVAEVLHFHRLALDEGRPLATAKRHEAGRRTVRENIADLVDDGSFYEYGPIVTATRLRSDTKEELEQRVIKTAADGMVMGVARVNGELVGHENARCVVMSYDYTVLAGTQGGKNHQKQDRMFSMAGKYRLPVVLYTEGGGGRTGGGSNANSSRQPAASVGGMNSSTWRELGKLSGLVPIVGVNSGYCFAGNVVLLGACDVIIATKNSSLGIGGPAVIEGGGLGAYAPAEVGPVSIQQPNGVIDILVDDDAAATAAAKKYLSFFQGRVKTWQAHDQRPLRHIVPENRRAVYDIRKLIETLADVDSMLELRPKFGVSMVTAFIRVEGHAVGVIANNSNSPTGGAIDSDGADKASRFMQLCDAFDIPILSLIDTPGNMVGPEAEKTALIRHCGRMYVAGANITVPYFVVVLRKSYGLGALAMSTGSFDETFFAISWPTGEFAGMGLEGSVKLGRRAELAAITNIPERKALYDKYVAEAYAWSRALNAATVMEVDDVIDPAETRGWLAMGLNSVPPRVPREGKKHSWVDTW
ncbi:MAG: carboxyl transferase domain-containing protein [Dehalococcoidia bacterium]